MLPALLQNLAAMLFFATFNRSASCCTLTLMDLHADADDVLGMGSALDGASLPVPVALPLPTLLAELDAWLRHNRAEPWRRNRDYLQEELELSLDSRGEHFRSSSAAYLDDYTEAVRKVIAQNSPARNQRHAALAASDVARLASVTPKAIDALWLDWLEAAGASTLSSRDLGEKRQALAAALAAAGHDAVAVLRRVQRIMEGDAVAEAEAEIAIGARPPSPDWNELRAAAPRLAAAARLELCRELLSSPPSWGRCIAWIAYRWARVDTYVESGPCTFVDAHRANASLADENGQPFPGRQELRDELSRPPIEEGHGEVLLARADLGWRSPVGAMDAAHDLVGALMETASIQTDGERWEPYGWEMLVLNGKRRYSRTFATPNVIRAWRRSDGLTRTARELARTGPRLGAVLAGSPLPTDLAEALRTATEARTAHVRSKVLLNDRVVELVAANAGAENAESLMSLLLGSWPEAGWQTQVLNGVQRALEAGRWTSADRRLELASELQTHGEDGNYVLHLTATFRHAKELLEFFPNKWLASSTADVFATFEDGPAYLAFIEEQRRECEILKTRLRRVRNALTHGNPVQVESIQTVQDLGQYCSTAALQQALDAFRDGYDLFAQLRAWDADRRRQLERVAAGETLVSLLGSEER